MNQEGIPKLLDRRMEFKIVRGMPGAKGSVRDCKVFGNAEGSEFFATVGCDRHVHIYDTKRFAQKDTLVGSAYLKQKLNCILLAPPATL